MKQTTGSRNIKAPLAILNVRHAAIFHPVALISAAVPLRCLVLASRLVFTLSLLGSTAYAATRYVRPGATGSNTGTDWANAYTALPSSLVRGDTYYLADGTYGSYSFDDNASGTNVIYIKKATSADHGDATGWSDSYGAGTALFSLWSFGGAPSGNGGYYNLNGYSPAVPGNYGIKVKVGDNTRAVSWADSGPYCEFATSRLRGRLAQVITILLGVRGFIIIAKVMPFTSHPGMGPVMPTHLTWCFPTVTCMDLPP